MNTPCTKLHLFVDGELSATEAEAFRHHLTRCAECEAGLRDLLQLELLASRALAGTGGEQAAPLRKVTQLRPWLHRAYRTAVPVALAAGLAAVAVVRFQAEPELPGEVWLASATDRQLDARLSHPKADRFRPYVPLRGTAHTAEVLPLRPLAELEERQDFRGIAAAYALRGDWQQAEAFLSRAPDSADKDNDLAVVAMSRSRWEDALGLLGGALRREPRHAQALWNRGLALQGRGLRRLAEGAFRDAATLPEQEEGWRQEAEARARDLRDSLETEGARWRKEVREASRRLSSGAVDVKREMQHPALAREALYEAVRTAPSPAAVMALMPLARELDRVVGGATVLQDYVRDVGARDFTARAPLARDYAKLLEGELVPGLLDTLRRSRESDLHFGALVHTGAAARDVEALRALERFADTSRDPWLRLLAERERAWGEDMRGRPSAEQHLLRTLRTCEAYSRVFNCAQIN
jgi:tetratricopeptide (TPR) repeat protein